MVVFFRRKPEREALNWRRYFLFFGSICRLSKKKDDICQMMRGSGLLIMELVLSNQQKSLWASHRVSYIGGLQESNRAKGNKALDTLLTEILNCWPNVEFMTSTELGECFSLNQK